MPAIKLDEETYQKALVKCKFNLIGGVILPKGAEPIKTATLHSKLSAIWNLKNARTISPLGKGYYCLRFSDAKDQHSAWTGGQKQLKPGTINLSPWIQDFVPEKLRQTNAQVWVRLYSLPWEYWDEPLLLSIGKTIGIPLLVDPATLRREFCLYARLLADVDLQLSFPSKVLMERDGFSFEINVSYQQLPDFCTHCSFVGHFVCDCRVLKKVQEESNRANESKNKQQQKRKPQPSSKGNSTNPPKSANAGTEIHSTEEIIDPCAKQNFTSEETHNSILLNAMPPPQNIINASTFHLTHPQSYPPTSNENVGNACQLSKTDMEPTLGCNVHTVPSPLHDNTSSIHPQPNPSFDSPKSSSINSVESIVPNTYPDKLPTPANRSTDSIHSNTPTTLTSFSSSSNRFAPLTGKFWVDEEEEPPIQSFVHSAEENLGLSDPQLWIELGEDLDTSVLNQDTPDNLKGTGIMKVLWCNYERYRAIRLPCCFICPQILNLKAQFDGVNKSPNNKEILRDRNGYVDNRISASDLAAVQPSPSTMLSAVHSLSSAQFNLSASVQHCIYGILGSGSSPLLILIFSFQHSIQSASSAVAALAVQNQQKMAIQHQQLVEAHARQQEEQIKQQQTMLSLLNNLLYKTSNDASIQPPSSKPYNDLQPPHRSSAINTAVQGFQAMHDGVQHLQCTPDTEAREKKKIAV
ncbi:hypothetical protein LguiA_016908 [Lonicera macranthoides]